MNGYQGYCEIGVFGAASIVTPPTLPTLKPVTFSGGNLIMAGMGGTPNHSYTVLTTTNLHTPLVNWTVSATGVTDGAGAFTNGLPVNANTNAGFFRLRMP